MRRRNDGTTSALTEIGQRWKILPGNFWRCRLYDETVAAYRGARLPVLHPLDLQISLRPRRKRYNISFAGGSPVGLHLEFVSPPRREIVVKEGALLYLGKWHVIGGDRRLCREDIATRRVLLAKKPHPRHCGVYRRELCL